MPRLYSDLLSSTGRRYYFGLNSAPGGISPAQATITVTGLAPTIFQQSTAFRTPAPALITINGLQVATDIRLSPTPATITLSGLVPSKQTTMVITNTFPLDYTVLPDNAPTILYIQTISPAPALIRLQSLELNITAGGNIGFVSPAPAVITLQSREFTLIFGEIGLGHIDVVGHAPTLLTSTTVTPEAGLIQLNPLAPTADRGFQWIDADPPPPLTWTTTTGVAA